VTFIFVILNFRIHSFRFEYIPRSGNMEIVIHNHVKSFNPLDQGKISRRWSVRLTFMSQKIIYINCMMYF